MTKLEAVNIMLQSIQETAVQSLDSGLIDAETAERILDDKKTDILEKGWSVNTDYNFRLSPDVDGKINVPATALRMDPTGVDLSRDLVPRMDEGTRRMWDKVDHTFVIDDSVYFDIVYDLDFADLPRAYQTYITYAAAEKYQRATIGSIVLDKFAVREKDEAWAAMLDAEAEQEDTNVLKQSESVRLAAWRNNNRALE